MFRKSPQPDRQHRVEATVANNRVDVFPFIMEMDRYRAAIAGSHHMDKSFHYHISILRSPYPSALVWMFTELLKILK